MIDFSPFLEGDDVAVCFDFEEEANDFLRELYKKYSKRFMKDSNYWHHHKGKTVYIPRLSSGYNMTYTTYDDAIQRLKVVHYRDLIIDEMMDIDFTEEDFAAIINIGL